LRTLKILKARITFYIGVIVTLLNAVQLIVSFDAIRIIGIIIGLFFVFWGLKVGWTQNRNLTIIVGHLALTIGCLVTAYAVYQIPFLEKAPSYTEVLDLPLFWGFFIIWGGNCMITHGYCSCAVRMHDFNNSQK
jgi:uncharacterized membrane protein YoaT (DUF817 family)